MLARVAPDGLRDERGGGGLGHGEHRRGRQDLLDAPAEPGVEQAHDQADLGVDLLDPQRPVDVGDGLAVDERDGRGPAHPGGEEGAVVVGPTALDHPDARGLRDLGDVAAGAVGHHDDDVDGAALAAQGLHDAQGEQVLPADHEALGAPTRRCRPRTRHERAP